MKWKEHKSQWKDCTGCELSYCRHSTVLARGSIPCDVLMVGEAPGFSEDTIGQPFVGPAGSLLDQIIEVTIDPQFKIAFTNLVCCIPLDGERKKSKEPKKSHITACSERLLEFVKEVARPCQIVAVGKLAAKHLPRILEGYNTDWPLIEIPHPSYILQNPVNRDLLLKMCEMRLSDMSDRLLPF